MTGLDVSGSPDESAAGARQPDAGAESPATMLRPARQADLESIERLLALSDLESTGMPELLAIHPEHVIVMDDSQRAGELAGVVAIEVCGEHALLRSVAVHPSWRKRQVGHALVRRMEVEAAELGIRALYLLTTTAEQFFPKLGFARIERSAVPEEIAATHEFQAMCPASAVVMLKRLAGGK